MATEMVPPNKKTAWGFINPEFTLYIKQWGFRNIQSLEDDRDTRWSF